MARVKINHSIIGSSLITSIKVGVSLFIILQFLISVIYVTRITYLPALDYYSVSVAVSKVSQALQPPEECSCECAALKDFDLSKAIIAHAKAKEMDTKQFANFYVTPKTLAVPIQNLSKSLEFSGLPIPGPGSTCVVVGSGGILLQYLDLGQKARIDLASRNAETITGGIAFEQNKEKRYQIVQPIRLNQNNSWQIDSYDYVIRMNLSPTKKYEKYVGSKTSLMFAYWNAIKKAANTGRELNNTHFIYSGFYHVEFENLIKLLQTKENGTVASMCRTSNITVAGHYTKEWIVHSFWKDFNLFLRPSTGFIALTLISHWCPNVPDFAGFGFLANKTVPYHYFDKSHVTGLHSANDEIRAIEKLKSCGLLGHDLTNVIQTNEILSN